MRELIRHVAVWGLGLVVMFFVGLGTLRFCAPFALGEAVTMLITATVAVAAGVIAMLAVDRAYTWLGSN